jgi:hypothetical protein
VSQDATEWGGSSDDTGKPQVLHNKDSSLLKGLEHRVQAKVCSPSPAMASK